MSNILCVYPDDPTTRFLNGFQMNLKKRYPQEFHCFKIKPSVRSHDKCLLSIRETNIGDLVIYIGHGRSDSLYGSKGKYSRAIFQDLIQAEELLDEYFEKDVFIDQSNIHVFSGKKVICLACNSKDYLGNWSIQAGCQVFIGFGDIPTDPIILKEVNKPLPTLIARFKGEIKWIMTESMFTTIEYDMSFHELVSTIKYFTNKRINHIILDHPNLRIGQLLTDYLFRFKEEIKLFGDGNLKVLGSA